jgi:epoxyqueuosine reductase
MGARAAYNHVMSHTSAPPDEVAHTQALKQALVLHARALGFAGCRITVPDVSGDVPHLDRWLALKRHGAMDYMERHRDLRANAQALLPGTLRAVCVRMDYLPADTAEPGAAQPGRWREEGWSKLHDVRHASISRYAHARDYHKVLRQRLQALAEHLGEQASEIGLEARHRVFTDSAPVMEVALATRAGLGWRGKHTLLLDRDGGSMFFLGGFYTTLPLPVDPPVDDHCGTCTACIDVCPTQAIVAPYELDARRCISYLTIEGPYLSSFARPSATGSTAATIAS